MVMVSWMEIRAGDGAAMATSTRIMNLRLCPRLCHCVRLRQVCNDQLSAHMRWAVWIRALANSQAQCTVWLLGLVFSLNSQAVVMSWFEVNSSVTMQRWTTSAVDSRGQLLGSVGGLAARTSPPKVEPEFTNVGWCTVPPQQVFNFSSASPNGCSCDYIQQLLLARDAS